MGDDGCVRLWDLRSTMNIEDSMDELENKSNFDMSAICLQCIHIGNNFGESVVDRCIFLPMFDNLSVVVKTGQDADMMTELCLTEPFLTFTKNGSCVSLWSSFSTSGIPPKRLRVFEIANESFSRYKVSLCTQPMAL